MRKIKDVLRLKFEARLSHEKIAAATGLSIGAVTHTVQRATQKGLSWPYRYSQFCAHYHEYRRTLARSMRQIHRAGEDVFIDYSGDTVAVIDSTSGEALTAEIFVATLGIEVCLR